jgi:hypothetical protein
MFHPQMRAVRGRAEGEGDDGAHGARTVVADVPGEGKPRRRLEGQHLGIDESVPLRRRRGAEGEAMTHDRLEIVLHQPVLDQRALGQRPPYLLRRMRQLALDDD